MNLAAQYDQLYYSAVERLRQNLSAADPLIDSPADRRFGLTLLLRPDEGTRKKISHFVRCMETVEPEQYYYPESDLHITVMSIISCYEGFNLNSIQPQAYCEVVQKVIEHTPAIDIHFRGVTASA